MEIGIASIIMRQMLQPATKQHETKTICLQFTRENSPIQDLLYAHVSSSSSSSSTFIVRLLQIGHRCITQSPTQYSVCAACGCSHGFRAPDFYRLVELSVIFTY